MDNLLEQFRRHLVLEGKSQQTIRGYIKRLRHFFRASGIEGPLDITKQSIEGRILQIKEESTSIGYLANNLWAIRKFTRFINEELRISPYIFDIKIPFPKAPDAVEYLEPDELHALLETIDIDDIHGLRTRAYIEILLNTGLRPSEALALDRDHISSDLEFEITGKGGKRRKIYLNNRARRWIVRYIKARNDECPALFVTHCTARRLSLRHAEHTFKNAVEKAGIIKRIHLHDLRHTYGTNLLIHGCPIDYVAVLMGHSSVNTTRRHYLAVRQKHAKAAHFKYLDYKTY